METVLLIIFGALAITGSLMVIFSKNTVHSALWMVAFFFFIAGIYILLHAEFIAMLQLIVYAGAIMMFILYAIMMLNIREEVSDRMPVQPLKLAGIAFLGFIFLLLLPMAVFGVNHSMLAPTGPFTEQIVEKFGHLAVLSNYLFSDFLFPFEITSILLTVGVVGSVMLAKK